MFVNCHLHTRDKYNHCLFIVGTGYLSLHRKAEFKMHVNVTLQTERLKKKWKNCAAIAK